MGRVAFWFIILFGVCYASAEEDVGEMPPSELTTMFSTTPLPTGPTHSNSRESTSDTWSELHPWATTEFTTTTSTTPVSESEQSMTPKNEDESSEEKDDKDKIPTSENDCDGDLSQADMQRFGDAVTSFSKNLLINIHQQTNSPNVVVSPFSIALGLLQLTLGAQGATEKKLLETLHMESFPCLHEKMGKITKRLVEHALSVATRIYVSKCPQIKDEFLEKSEKFYGSKALNLGPDVQENVASINKWVSDATKGKITNFLKDLPKEIMLILLNAIHFKGVWKNKFDPNNTFLDAFYANDKVVMVDMMLATKYPLTYRLSEKLDSLVARLPFKENMSFYIVIPNEMEWNVSKILENFNQSELNSRLSREKPTTLKLPKLNLDFKLDLKEALKSLGLGELFNKPNLQGISNKTLVVSAIEHQSVLDLNEEGVEAAGATAVLVSRSLSTFSVNRPFLFFLYDDLYNLLLFHGFVREPKPGTLKNENVHHPEFKVKGFIPK